jgi:hypothetical protein
MVEIRSYQLDLPLAMLAAIVLSACAAAQVPAAQPFDIDEGSPHQASAAAASERDAGSVRIIRAGSAHHEWRPKGEHRGGGPTMNLSEEHRRAFRFHVVQLPAGDADAVRGNTALPHHLDLPPPAVR